MCLGCLHRRACWSVRGGRRERGRVKEDRERVLAHTLVTFCFFLIAWHGMAWLGMVCCCCCDGCGFCKAWRGIAWRGFGMCGPKGMGEAGVKEWHGMAWMQDDDGWIDGWMASGLS
jgi:hypothetical protein